MESAPPLNVSCFPTPSRLHSKDSAGENPSAIAGDDELSHVQRWGLCSTSSYTL